MVLSSIIRKSSAVDMKIMKLFDHHLELLLLFLPKISSNSQRGHIVLWAKLYYYINCYPDVDCQISSQVKYKEVTKTGAKPETGSFKVMTLLFQI